MTDAFKTVLYQSLTLKQGAQLALDNRLYVPGWQLSHVLQRLKTDQSTTNRIALGFLDGIPIAVAVLEDGHAQAFCRKIYRRNGYGSRCVNALKTQQFQATVGVDGSDKFWQKMGAKWTY